MEQKKFEVGGKRAHFVLIICGLLYAVNWMDRQVFSVVTAPMMEALKLTKSEMGWIQNFFILSIGLFAIPVSYLVDRWSRTKAMATMAVIWSAATFVTGLGKSFVSVLLPRIVVGVGEAGYGSGGTALIGASYHPEERGHKLAIFNMFVAVGIMAGLIIGGLVAKAYGWAAPFFVFAVPGFILALLVLTLQDYPARPKTADGGESFLKNSAAIWKIPTLRWLYFGYGMYMVVIVAVSHWNIAMLMFRFKLSVAQAPFIMAASLLFSLIFYPIGGRLADRWEKKRVGGRMRYAAICSTVAAVAAILYFYVTFIAYKGTFGEWGGLMIAGLALYLFHTMALGGISGAVGATTQAVVPANLRSLSFGWAMTCMYALGGGWGSGVAATLADKLGTGQRGDWLGMCYGMMIVCICGIIAGLLWWKSSTHYEEDLKKVANM